MLINQYNQRLTNRKLSRVEHSHNSLSYNSSRNVSAHGRKYRKAETPEKINKSNNKKKNHGLNLFQGITRIIETGTPLSLRYKRPSS